jgi:hypothetical protein
MLVGVSDRTIYGFEKHRGHHEAGRLVFRVDRAELDVKVSRANRRVLLPTMILEIVLGR